VFAVGRSAFCFQAYPSLHAVFGRGSEVVRAEQASNRKLDFSSLGGLDDPA
jgi:hypothetical protein